MNKTIAEIVEKAAREIAVNWQRGKFRSDGEVVSGMTPIITHACEEAVANHVSHGLLVAAKDLERAHNDLSAERDRHQLDLQCSRSVIEELRTGLRNVERQLEQAQAACVELTEFAEELFHNQPTLNLLSLRHAIIQHWNKVKSVSYCGKQILERLERAEKDKERLIETLLRVEKHFESVHERGVVAGDVWAALKPHRAAIDEAMKK